MSYSQSGPATMILKMQIPANERTIDLVKRTDPGLRLATLRLLCSLLSLWKQLGYVETAKLWAKLHRKTILSLHALLPRCVIITATRTVCQAYRGMRTEAIARTGL